MNMTKKTKEYEGYGPNRAPFKGCSLMKKIPMHLLIL